MSAQEELLPCIEIEPDGIAKHSIIWLHGLGADGSDFVPIVPELRLPSQLGVRFIFPDAPVMPITVNNGYEMRAWYDIYSLSSLDKRDHIGVKRSIVSVSQLIEREIARGVSSENIILAGFSQGAAIALTAGISYLKPLAGILALSGYLPLAEETFTHAHNANRIIPIFIAHGTDDMVVPYALGKATYAAIQAAHYPVTWRSYPMAHSVCGPEVADISKWIQEVFG